MCCSFFRNVGMKSMFVLFNMVVVLVFWYYVVIMMVIVNIYIMFFFMILIIFNWLLFKEIFIEGINRCLCNVSM